MPDDVDLRARPTATTLLAIAAAGAVAPFIVSSASTSFSTVNGEITRFVYRDWIAVAGGGSAVLFGLLAVVFSLRAKAMGLVAAAAVIALLGGYQIARGLGVFAPAPAGEMQSELSLPAMPPQQPPQPRSMPPVVAVETCPDKDTCDNLAHPFHDSAPAKWIIGIERACTFGQEFDCDEAGDYWRAQKQAKKAFALYERACTLGNRQGCLDGGVQVFQGDGIDKDVTKGLALIDKGCDYGSLVACKDMSVIYDNGEGGIAKDAAKAFAYAEKSCGDGGFDAADGGQVAFGCTAAGVALFEGIGRKIDADKGFAYFDKACGYSASYCANLGIAFNIGKGTKKDQAKARELFTRSCDADNATGCRELSVLLKKGQGGAKDPAGATTAMEHACKLDPDYCPKQK